MTTIISFIIVLGVLIFIHELGHFLVAKYSGVGVEKFSLGFGPKIFGITSGETEYRLSLLPLGGYVKMVGESATEAISEEDKLRSFNNQPVLNRAAIVAAGPIMNLVLAAVLLPIIFMIGIQLPAYLEKPVLVGYVAPGEAADKAGIKAGDAVATIDGHPIRDWEEFLEEFALNPGRQMKAGVVREGQMLHLDIVPDTSEKTGVGYGGVYPPMKPLIGDVSEGYPAKAAGIQAGDLIISVDGKPLVHWAELEGIIHKSGEKKIFVVARGEETLTFEVTPKFNEDANVFLVGIARKEDYVVRKYGLFESIGKGYDAGLEMTERLYLVVKGLVAGQYSLKTLGGPIMIAQVAGKAAETGLAEVLSLMAFLSLQLGIINLFPIPVLDGGHIMFFGFEAIKGKPLSERFMAVCQQIGIVLLIGLMVLVTYNDLLRIFGDKIAAIFG